jgi:hypothetical protein
MGISGTRAVFEPGFAITILLRSRVLVENTVQVTPNISYAIGKNECSSWANGEDDRPPCPIYRYRLIMREAIA